MNMVDDNEIMKGEKIPDQSGTEPCTPEPNKQTTKRVFRLMFVIPRRKNFIKKQLSNIVNVDIKLFNTISKYKNKTPFPTELVEQYHMRLCHQGKSILYKQAYNKIKTQLIE